MFRAITLIGIGLTLGACDFVVQKAEERAAAELGNAAAELGNAAGELGNVAMNFDLDLPTELLSNGKFEISGVPMIPGGKITNVKVSAGQSAPTVNLAFTAPTSPEQVKNYFVEQFRAQGVTASMAADVLTGTTKEGQPFTMRFAPEGSGTSGTIELNTRK